jgi:hypothetical protein
VPCCLASFVFDYNKLYDCWSLGESHLSLYVMSNSMMAGFFHVTLLNCKFSLCSPHSTHHLALFHLLLAWTFFLSFFLFGGGRLGGKAHSHAILSLFRFGQ